MNKALAILGLFLLLTAVTYKYYNLPLLAVDSETVTTNQPLENPADSPAPEEKPHPLVPETKVNPPAILDRQNVGTANQITETSPQPASLAATSITPPKQMSTAPVEKGILFQLGIWWSTSSFALQLWYFFFSASVILYLLKLKQLRKPLLLLSLIVLGFYLGAKIDPINAIFSLLSRKPASLIPAVSLLIVPIGLSLLWGRIYCGWVCPFGAIQEFIYPKRKNSLIPKQLDKPLKYLKYFLLFSLAYLTWRTTQNLWYAYEPFKTLFTFSGSPLTITFLWIILFLSLLIERPFCRYLCPLGAVLAFTSRFAPFKMRADAETCVVCGKCTSGTCAMNALEAFNPLIDSPVADTAECITCFECQETCRRDALKLTCKQIDRNRIIIKEVPGENIQA